LLIRCKLPGSFIQHEDPQNNGDLGVHIFLLIISILILNYISLVVLWFNYRWRSIQSFLHLSIIIRYVLFADRRIFIIIRTPCHLLIVVTVHLLLGVLSEGFSDGSPEFLGACLELGIVQLKLEGHSPHVLAAFLRVRILLQVEIGEGQVVPGFGILIVVLDNGVEDSHGILELLELDQETAGHHAELYGRKVVSIVQHQLHSTLEEGAGLIILSANQSEICEGLKSIKVF
jgi:hypothetical protein